MRLVGYLFLLIICVVIAVFLYAVGPNTYRFFRDDPGFRAWLRKLWRRMPDRWEVAIALLLWLVGWVAVKLINHSY